MRLFKQKLRPILRWRCWFKSSGSGCRGGSRVSQVQWRSNDDFLRPISDQQFIRHVLVTVRIAWNLGQSGTKKVSGTRYSTQWKTPQKWTVPNRTVPYHAVEKRHYNQVSVRRVNEYRRNARSCKYAVWCAEVYVAQRLCVSFYKGCLYLAVQTLYRWSGFSAKT